jgi:hypothetical protein
VVSNIPYDEAVLLAKIMVKQTGLAAEEPAIAALCSALVLADAELQRLRPVLEAASGLLDKARKCVDRPYVGCPFNHDDVESWIGDAIDAARSKS